VAIVGSGIIGRNHAAAILREPRLRLTALVDPFREASDQLAKWIVGEGGPTPAQFDSLATALAKTRVDLVVICSPSGTHTPLAQEALEAGAHVVVEKPLDSSLAAARRLTRLAAEAETRGQLFSVISQHRFDPASVAVARAISSGSFGRLTSAVASVAWWRGQGYYDSAGWRGTWAQDGGGATFNQGIHTVDLLLWLLGRPLDVSAQTGVLAHERIEVEDVAVATVRFATGALAVLHATTAAYPGLAVRLQIHGSRGSAIIHDDQLEYFYAGGDDDAPTDPVNQAASVVPAAELRGGVKPADNFVLGHVRQYDDIVAAIAAGRPSAVGADDALLALATVKAVYLSASLGRTIPVDAVVAGEFDEQLIAIETSTTVEAS
jgi:predicted dehydrogenase